MDKEELVDWIRHVAHRYAQCIVVTSNSPTLRLCFAVFLLLTGRCYEAEINVILLLLRCSFRWYPFLPGSKFSDFGRKPWTIVHGFIFGSPKKCEKSIPT